MIIISFDPDPWIGYPIMAMIAIEIQGWSGHVHHIPGSILQPNVQAVRSIDFIRCKQISVPVNFNGFDKVSGRLLSIVKINSTIRIVSGLI
jgi:hypothetical protein